MKKMTNGIYQQDGSVPSLNSTSPTPIKLQKKFTVAQGIGRSLLQMLSGVILLGITAQAMALNAIQIENAIPVAPVDGSWNEFPIPNNPHDIEGYASQTSVSVSTPLVPRSIKIYANVNPARDQTYTLTVFRMGWYHGIGARRMTTPVVRTSVAQVLPTPDPVTGLVEANWTAPNTIDIPSTWVSGVYIATLVGNTTGEGQYVPFVVKNNASDAAYVFQTADTTWQAYNAWGGKSLYGFNSTGGVKAVKVSYNRPYDDGAGMGGFTNFEWYMMRFLEREGYDVTYQSSADTHIDSNLTQLAKHKTILSIGHDEYWTLQMRNNIEKAKKRGISLGFFGANMAYWKARFENSTKGAAVANRTLVSYKENAATQDPLALDGIATNDNQVTTLFRDTQYSNRPENALIGIMYVYNPVNSDVVVTNYTHWIYTGTGLYTGDKLIGMLGYEVDAYFSASAPSGVEILAHSPFIDDTNTVAYSDMSVYSADCNLTPCVKPQATVFATGTMNWVYGLDSTYRAVNLENWDVEKITRNVMSRLENSSAALPAHCPNHGLDGYSC